jgi:SAM-dependent methyltransferase
MWRRYRVVKTLAAGALVLALTAPSAALQSAVQAPARKPDVPYEPTPPEVVDVMVGLARLHAGDVVYDLGCGDGRIVIAAVKTPGVRGVCVDIDPQRIEESRKNAQAAGVARRIEFRTQDLFEARFDDATVVMLFLWPEVNLKLRPRLRTLKPGTRVVSHWHDMGDWKADAAVNTNGNGRPRPIYMWIIPAHSGPPGTF